MDPSSAHSRENLSRISLPRTVEGERGQAKLTEKIYMKRVVGVVGLALLIYGSVLVFQAFDHNSHSVSDTIRPFLITMLPVWVVYLAAARAVLR